MTTRRESYFEKMEKIILGNQFGRNVIMLDTSFSYHILIVFPKQIRLASKKNLREKFDYLFALTKKLMEYDLWINDHEETDEIRKMLKGLASAWKKILSNSDEELCIDPDLLDLESKRCLINLKILYLNLTVMKKD